MDPQPRVETVEDFKLRISALIRGKPEHIPVAPRPNPLLVRAKSVRSPEKHNVVRQTDSCTFTAVTEKSATARSNLSLSPRYPLIFAGSP